LRYRHLNSACVSGSAPTATPQLRFRSQCNFFGVTMCASGADRMVKVQSCVSMFATHVNTSNCRCRNSAVRWLSKDGTSVGGPKPRGQCLGIPVFPRLPPQNELGPHRHNSTAGSRSDRPLNSSPTGHEHVPAFYLDYIFACEMGESTRYGVKRAFLARLILQWVASEKSLPRNSNESASCGVYSVRSPLF